jgi:hypothetical protein
MTPFGKHSEMTIYEREPFNAEAPLGRLRQSYLTAGELLSRNHALEAGAVQVRAYAIAGQGHRLELMNLSPNEGRTWVEARRREGTEDLWAPGSSTAPQSAAAEEVWNIKGYANNIWHGVRVVAR